jgi:hypothetical protein
VIENYADEKDVILFWKTQMLYYVKTDRIFRSLPVEIDLPAATGTAQTGGFKFYFDASKIESKKANEKRSLVFELDIQLSQQENLFLPLIAKVIVGFFMFGLRINNMCRVKAHVFLLSLVAASFSLRYVLVFSAG